MNLPWVQQMGAVLPWRRTALFYGLTAWNTGWMCCSHCHGSVGSFAGIHAAPDPSGNTKRRLPKAAECAEKECSATASRSIKHLKLRFVLLYQGPRKM